MIKRTSAEWYADDFGVVILDYDGWDRANIEFSFDIELVSFSEYQKRKSKSTTMIMSS